MDLGNVEAAILDIREGRMVIVVDEEDRENEGDLTMAAEKVTPEAINFMATCGKGLICMPMMPERLDELGVPLMVSDNESAHETAFCVSIEARHNVSTGISAADRATTILTAANPETRAKDLIKPGHVFPLRSRRGGVLKRAGQTEASVDLARLAELSPAGVICEVMNEDGTMARLSDLKKFSQKHNIRIISVVDLIKFRLRTERFVKCIHQSTFDSDFGNFKLHVFENEIDGELHLAFVKGDIRGKEPVLVRVQKEALLGDVFLDSREISGRELRSSLRIIQEAGRGVFVYLRLKEEQKRFLQSIQSQTSNNPRNIDSDDFRNYGIGAQILTGLGLQKIKILTNHPKKMVGVDGFGLVITDQLSVETYESSVNLEAKPELV